MTGIDLHNNLAFTNSNLNHMKNLIPIVFLIVLCGALQAQNNEKIYGAWDFTTETGEVEYETGVMDISKESVMTTFTDNSYKYPSDWLKFVNDTLKFNFDVDGTMVECYLVLKDKSHLIGYAEWETGETVMNLTRTEKKE